jgi:hypothetical protein
VVGALRSNPKDTEAFAEPFRRYMKAIGWEEGRNIRFLFVWAEGRNERAPALAGELVAKNVDLIITFGDVLSCCAHGSPARLRPLLWMAERG